MDFEGFSSAVDAPSDRYCRSAWNAVCRSQAVIEFDTAGVITWANERFLDLVGYRSSNLVGRHHRTLCEPEYAASPDYERFWNLLRRGEFEAGEFARKRADGSKVWLQATYNPIFEGAGKIHRILKVASDVTRQVTLERALQAKHLTLQGTLTELGAIVATISGVASQTRLLGGAT